MNARSLRFGLLLVVLAAVALRFWHIAADLPDFLEEAIPFRSALELWSWTGSPTDWNPHFFNYPSLTLYLHFLLQKLAWIVAHAAGLARSPADWFLLYLANPSGMVIPARVAHVAFDALAVGLTGLVAERVRRGAGVPAALLAALSATLVTTARSISTDTVMGALALGALNRMLAWRERGGARRLVSAVVLIGLATGAKYPAALVLLPLAWILWARDQGRGLALWPWCVAGALGVFLLTTPYALLDFTAFRRDFGYESLHVASGHLGQATGVGLPFHVRNLLRDLGPVGLALLGVSAALMVPRTTRTIAVAVWLYLLVFLGPIAVARFGAERYLVPVVPAAAALAAAAALELAARSAPRWRAAVAVVLLGGFSSRRSSRERERLRAGGVSPRSRRGAGWRPTSWLAIWWWRRPGDRDSPRSARARWCRRARSSVRRIPKHSAATWRGPGSMPSRCRSSSRGACRAACSRRVGTRWTWKCSPPRLISTGSPTTDVSSGGWTSS